MRKQIDAMIARRLDRVEGADEPDRSEMSAIERAWEAGFWAGVAAVTTASQKVAVPADWRQRAAATGTRPILAEHDQDHEASGHRAGETEHTSPQTRADVERAIAALPAHLRQRSPRSAFDTPAILRALLTDEAENPDAEHSYARAAEVAGEKLTPQFKNRINWLATKDQVIAPDWVR